MHQSLHQHSLLQKPCCHFLLLILISLLSLAFANKLQAHELRPSIAEISLQQPVGQANYEAQARIRVNLESLIAEIGTDHDDTDDSPKSGLYKQLRALAPNELIESSFDFQKKLVDSLSILSNTGRQVDVSIRNVETTPEEDRDLARNSFIHIDFAFEADETGFTWQWPEEFGEVIVRTESRSEKLDYAALLPAGQSSETIQLGVATEIGLVATVSNYVVIGFQHIIPKGLDHILFIIGLFLLSPYWKPLLIQVTTFTLAHSITLALTILGYLSFPAYIVEPLIALSIVYVCVENIFLKNLQKLRIVVVFLFGLLHGMGFASVLTEVGLQSQHFIAALLSFNVGVELGQLFILALCVLLIGLWFRNKSWYQQRISRPVSIAVGLVGCYWFLERTVPLILKG